MSRASGIVAKIDAALTKYIITDRDVYLRRTTQSGGDALTGRGVSTRKADSLLTPQPAVEVASDEYPLVVAGQSMSADANYLMTVSPSAMALADVTDETVSIVFKTSSNPVQEEELFIAGFKASIFQGVDVAFECVLSSKKR